MATTSKSPHGVKTTTVAYENFQGLDTSRSLTAQDTKTEQTLSLIENAYCDWRGQIVRDPGASYREGQYLVVYTKHFGIGESAWAERTGSGINLNSARGHIASDVYPVNATVSGCVFNQNLHFFARALPPYRYDGIKWSQNQSPDLQSLRPSYAAPVQRRMAVAGIPGKETQVHISRVDQEEIFPGDEDAASNDVLRAGFIDIANQIGTADQITGLASFEQNRLVIFTSDRALVFQIDPDITAWTIDDRTNIHIGCVSHNTIVNAGTDVIFCSRAGVHSIRRSQENGILVYSVSFSDKIDLLYREYFNSVPDKETISAVWDQDESQYHIFFPQAGGFLTKRLTLSLNPEGEAPQPKWSTGDFLNARCGSFLSGQLLFGTPGGIYEIKKLDEEAETTPDATILTPMLWHGDFNNSKQTHSLIVQAAGKAIVDVSAVDEEGRSLGSMSFEVDDTDDNRFIDVPLSSQYERKWETRYRGAQYRVVVKEGNQIFRLMGIAVVLKG